MAVNLSCFNKTGNKKQVTEQSFMQTHFSAFNSPVCRQAGLPEVENPVEGGRLSKGALRQKHIKLFNGK